MRRLRFLRIVYLFPILLLAFWPVGIPCEQCGVHIVSHSFAARLAARFEDNFLCGMDCALDYLKDNPIERDDQGNIIIKN